MTDRPVAFVFTGGHHGAAYRGKAGCRDIRCTQDGNPDRCYGWHCVYCDAVSNCQGDCTNPECPGRS
jgi:hypothetical protein